MNFFFTNNQCQYYFSFVLHVWIAFALSVFNSWVLLPRIWGEARRCTEPHLASCPPRAAHQNTYLGVRYVTCGLLFWVYCTYDLLLLAPATGFLRRRISCLMRLVIHFTPCLYSHPVLKNKQSSDGSHVARKTHLLKKLVSQSDGHLGFNWNLANINFYL